MDRLEAMAVFLAVVEAGSLSAASRRLGVPLATVSRKLSELEAHLKTRLLVRSTRQLSLTEAGQDYLRACQSILEQVDEAERAAAGEYAAPRGRLALTAPVLFGRLHVVPIVAEFLASYPEVDVQLVLADRIVNLLEEHLDLAVRIGELPDSGLVAQQVGQIRQVVCGSPAYFAAHPPPEVPEALATHPCVTFEGLGSSTAWSFPGRGPVPIRSRLSVNTADAALAAARAGVGITRVLSYQLADDLQDGRLVRVLEAFEPPPVPVRLIHAGQGRLPMKCQVFLEFAVSRLRGRLGAVTSH